MEFYTQFKCLYNYDESNLTAGELYGIPESEYKYIKTVSELVNIDDYDKITYISANISSYPYYDFYIHDAADIDDEDRSSRNELINFKFPKNLKILHIGIYDSSSSNTEYDKFCINYMSDIPDTLEHLCIRNPILPNKLPSKLRSFACPTSRISKLPELPDTLEYLLCSDNNIIQLPKLPKSLKILNCARNKLTKLPDLPDGLIFLGCQKNKLTELPKLPASLKTMNCSSNQIIKLPYSLLNCDMSIQYDIYDGYLVDENVGKKKADQFQYFIYDNNPIHGKVKNNYYINKNNIFRKVAKAPMSRKLRYYFKKLKLAETLEPIYIEARWNPNYILCQNILMRDHKEFFG